MQDHNSHPPRILAYPYHQPFVSPRYFVGLSKEWLGDTLCSTGCRGVPALAWHDWPHDLLFLPQLFSIFRLGAFPENSFSCNFTFFPLHSKWVSHENSVFLKRPWGEGVEEVYVSPNFTFTHILSIDFPLFNYVLPCLYATPTVFSIPHSGTDSSHILLRTGHLTY